MTTGSDVTEGTSREPSGLSALVAVRDDDLEPALLALVDALERRRSVHPTILSVFDPRQYPTPPVLGNLLASATALLGPEFQEERRARLREHLATLRGQPTSWPVEVDVGGVAASVRACTGRTHPDLVIMGLHHHGVVDRALGIDTARQIMEHVRVPVLAARPELRDLPGHVIVAVDFSRASVRAARIAARLLDERGTLHLVYVCPAARLGEEEGTEGLAVILSGGILAAFAGVLAQLSLPPTVKVVRAVLEGDPIDELIKFATGHAPDLVVVGSQSHAHLSRLLATSVTAALVHDSRWSVLATPPGVDESPDGAENGGVQPASIPQ